MNIQTVLEIFQIGGTNPPSIPGGICKNMNQLRRVVNETQLQCHAFNLNYSLKDSEKGLTSCQMIGFRKVNEFIKKALTQGSDRLNPLIDS